MVWTLRNGSRLLLISLLACMVWVLPAVAQEPAAASDAPEKGELRRSAPDPEQAPKSEPAQGEAPKVLQKVDPRYPEEAKKKGLQGTVVLEVAVDDRGDVKEVKVVRSDDRVFEEPAVEAVRQWKFEPSVKEGRPAPATFKLTVAFRLH